MALVVQTNAFEDGYVFLVEHTKQMFDLDLLACSLERKRAISGQSDGMQLVPLPEGY